jgi:hypothetical protein
LSLSSSVYHFGHSPRITDVSRVDPQAIYSRLQSGQSKAMIKVDVGNERGGRLFSDGLERLNRFFIQYGESNQLTTNLSQSFNLFQGCFDISSIRVAHGLDNHRGISTHRHASNPDLPGLFSDDIHVKHSFFSCETGICFLEQPVQPAEGKQSIPALRAWFDGLESKTRGSTTLLTRAFT